MKFLIAIITVVALASAEFTDEERQKWLDFKLEYNKLFLSPGKEKERMGTFLKNAKEIQAHNEAFENGQVSYEKAVHKHSDLTDEAFLARFGGVKMPVEARRVDPRKVVTLRQTPPASLNWTALMPTWEVRDQASCGSCWTFSTVGAVESAYYIKNKVLQDFSEQQLVDCVYGSDGGCDGGWMPDAFDYLRENGGGALESDYPYKAVSSKCQSTVTKSVLMNNPTSYVQVASDDDSIKNALNKFGALAVCVDASGWSSYKKGIFKSSKYTRPSCTHAVVLTGYGKDSSGKAYWIIRNSWDDWWGELGYMRLDARRNAKGKTYGGVMLDYAYYAQVA